MHPWIRDLACVRRFVLDEWEVPGKKWNENIQLGSQKQDDSQFPRKYGMGENDDKDENEVFLNNNKL